MSFEPGTRVVLVAAREYEPDPYAIPGQTGVVLSAHTVTEEEAALARTLLKGEDYYQIKWDRQYVSCVYPADGDFIKALAP